MPRTVALTEDDLDEIESAASPHPDTGRAAARGRVEVTSKMSMTPSRSGRSQASIQSSADDLGTVRKRRNDRSLPSTCGKMLRRSVMNHVDTFACR